MAHLAAEMRFEEATELRDRIQALERYSAKQKIVTTDEIDRDLFALAREPEYDVACGVLFKVREGKIIGRQHKYLHRIEGRSTSDLMQSFVEDYYTDTMFFPDAVFLSEDLTNPEPLMQHLHEKKGKKVEWRTPERGEKAELMRMVEANARLLLDEYKLQQTKQQEDRIPHSIKALQRDLRLKALPRHIECFDISHLSGTGTVASCVVFEDGKPLKRAYRTYKIKSAEGKPDDFQSMREVVGRRYKKIKADGGPWPDLIVIDGGKGQLSSAVTTLKEIEAYGESAVIGLAKRLEEVFLPGDTEAIMIPKTSSALRLLQRVRDEAHRFAVTFQRKQRSKVLKSELLDISGVGEKTTRKLLKKFGSVRKVKLASVEEIAELTGHSTANKIRTYFNKK
jgi:excinuclease ABC subunit C